MMGMFRSSNETPTISEEVDNATSEKNVEEDWGVIISICDKAGKEAKGYLKCILKRLGNPDPHIGVKAVTLLDACIKNSGPTFHREVASREFENEFMKLMQKSSPVVAKKLRESLKKWAENEFKSDPQLNLIPTLYSKLRSNGLDFSSSDTAVRKPSPINPNPNVVESQEEEEQILKAIELSLKESSGSPRAQTKTPTVAQNQTASLYPSVNMATAAALPPPSTAPAKEPRKVRALYDFEAAEDNELTFNTGEIIFVIDDSDPNWWKGSNQRGEGLFPSNFVTGDLTAEPEKLQFEKSKKSVQFSENTEVKTWEKELEDVEINEEKINRLLHLLHEADPTNPERDTEEMLKLEGEVNAMGPLIDTELERVDRKHAQLTQLSADLVEALNLYHTLMREPQYPPVSKVPYGYAPPPTSLPYNNGLPPPNMHPSMMGPQSMGPQSMGPPGLPPGHHIPPHYATMPMPNSGPTSSHGTIPAPGQGMTHPGMPSHMQHPQQLGEDRRQDPSMGHYAGLPNYGLPSLQNPNFPQNTSNSSIQGPPPPFVSSSSHMMH